MRNIEEYFLKAQEITLTLFTIVIIFSDINFDWSRHNSDII